jgi:hypothetical protein
LSSNKLAVTFSESGLLLSYGADYDPKTAEVAAAILGEGLLAGLVAKNAMVGVASLNAGLYKIDYDSDSKKFKLDPSPIFEIKK